MSGYIILKSTPVLQYGNGALERYDHEVVAWARWHGQAEGIAEGERRAAALVDPNISISVFPFADDRFEAFDVDVRSSCGEQSDITVRGAEGTSDLYLDIPYTREWIPPWD